MKNVCCEEEETERETEYWKSLHPIHSDYDELNIVGIVNVVTSTVCMNLAKAQYHQIL